MSDRPSGTICTPAELEAANPDCLTRSDSLASAFKFLILKLFQVMAEAPSFVTSLAAVGFVFAIILLVSQRRRLPMDLLMLSLFFADVLQAIGGAMSARWVHVGIVDSGTFCCAQAVIQSVGDTSALYNLAIGVFTFVILWLGRDIVAEYPWITLLFSLLIYMPILWFRVISFHRWRQAFVFLGYPVLYCLLVLPLSAARWIGFGNTARGATQRKRKRAKRRRR